MLFKPHIIYTLLILILQTSLLASGSETTAEYLVLLPAGLQKPLSLDQLSAYFNTGYPPQIDYFPESLTAGNNRWALVRSAELTEEDMAQLKLSGKILGFQQNHVLRFDDTVPNDPLYKDQWYHTALGAAQIWPDIPAGKEIIVGVIDTGIEYDHPDLVHSIWINRAEDINQNGILDAGDINGYDDDGNGYIDDVAGWDFTDAPRFPDGGDYLDEDNDPSDEYFQGHGTQVAGIIAAGINNNTGIAGLVPGIRIMNLRAGTANGYLEEDDVARAVLYAVDNGARVINMSFGDTELSGFLSDVLKYAYRQGIVLVASVGNSGDNIIHFPAALSETIAVGSSGRDGTHSDFSCWGGLLDLSAPGEEILSCSRDGGYNVVQGTSFSAPMVSAAAGLLLILDPDLKNEDVRHLLRSTATDVTPPGWDPYTGAGILNFPRLYAALAKKNLQILNPSSGSSQSADRIPVVITAKDPLLRSFSLQLGVGDQPDKWETLVADHPYQVIEDTLTWLTLSGSPDTAMVLRLISRDWRGGNSEARSVFTIDRTPPQLSGIRTKLMLDGDRYAVLLELETDDIVRSELYFRPSGSNLTFEKKSFRFETNSQKMILNSSEIPEDGEFYIRNVNKSGLITISDNAGSYYHWTLKADPVWSPDFDQIPWTFPAGYALDFATDFDHDGMGEVVISRYDQNNAYGPLQIYEFDQRGFQLRSETAARMIPRDAGDADGDGFEDILAGFGQRSYLLEANPENPMPVDISWQDTSFWGSRITDLDGDGIHELLGRRQSSYELLEAEGDNRFGEVFNFTNLSPGSNNLGPPRTVTGDFDGDGRTEIVYGDYDGDLIIYENDGDNHYRYSTSIRLPFPDATDYFCAWDLPDGRCVLAAGCFASGTGNYEHEFEARYWEYLLFENDGSDRFTATDTILINGYNDVRFFDSGITTVPFQSDTLLAVAPSPGMYFLRSEPEKPEPFAVFQGVRTNTMISYDFDRNGVPEIYFNNGNEFTGIEPAEKPRPPAPRGFSAIPLDTRRIKLSWDAVINADYYILLRGGSPDTLNPIDSVYGSVNYTDASLTEGRLYYYAIETISSAYPQHQSPRSVTVRARPNQPPEVDSVLVLNENQVRLTFNEPMLVSSLTEDHFRLMPDDQFAQSVVTFRNGGSVLITFGGIFEASVQYHILAGQVQDLDRTFLKDSVDQAGFVYSPGGREPYIRKWYRETGRRIVVEFSEPMDTTTVQDPVNYTLHPSGEVLHIQKKDIAGRMFAYELSANSFSGATGVDSRLICHNLMSAAGVLFNEGNEINLAGTTETLGQLLPYPQPATAVDVIIFANVPDDTEIRIFDLQGNLVRRLEPKQAFGGMQWDLKNKKGEKVAAGIYIYSARNGSESRLGKISIIR